MQQQSNTTTCTGTNDACTAPQNTNNVQGHKPIELYTFVDPVCPECWGLEPITKKLVEEYGDYFTLRHVIGGKREIMNKDTCRKQTAERWEKTANLTGMSCDGDVLYQDRPPSSYRAALAVKAAELQGKSAGKRFLRLVREHLFLKKENINETDVLLKCAEEANLDLAEYKRDIVSEGPVKALQCDRRITTEMDVNALPALVFFNIDEACEGIKVTGHYQYDVYVQILTEMLGKKPEPKQVPDIIDFMKKHQFVATKELSEVYNRRCEEIEKEMKKLVLRQLVERVPVKYGTFWRYIGQ